MEPTKVSCFAFPRHSDSSPGGSVTAPYLSVFGTPTTGTGNLVEEWGACTESWGAHGLGSMELHRRLLRVDGTGRYTLCLVLQNFKSIADWCVGNINKILICAVNLGTESRTV